ncbi:hypothetical protein J6590_040541 [Homalodisca vitripennis]|nr:hypothetical protein J6590_040541 [Homalodisca vitripennis]
MDLLESVSELNSSELGVNDSDVSDIDENELVRDFEIDSDSEHSFNEELPADSEVEGEPDVEDDQQNLPVPEDEDEQPVAAGRYPYCRICARRKNRKTTVSCSSCQIPICKEHTKATCTRCPDADEAMDTD